MIFHILPYQPPPMRHRSMRVFMNDDRHVMAKHSVIYPTQEELESVQNMVSHTERALKAVSDWLDKQEKGTSKSDSDGTDTDKERWGDVSDVFQLNHKKWFISSYFLNTFWNFFSVWCFSRVSVSWQWAQRSGHPLSAWCNEGGSGCQGPATEGGPGLGAGAPL